MRLATANPSFTACRLSAYVPCMPLPGTILSCSMCSPRKTVDVSPEHVWLLVLHAHVDHGIPMEVLERMYLGVAIRYEDVEAAASAVTDLPKFPT